MYIYIFQYIIISSLNTKNFRLSMTFNCYLSAYNFKILESPIATSNIEYGNTTICKFDLLHIKYRTLILIANNTNWT